MPKGNPALNNSLEIIVMVVLAVVVFLPPLYGLAGIVLPSKTLELSVVDTGEQCFEEAASMRVNHGRLLRQSRDQSVREGIVGEVELNRCRECHASRASFCDRCHNVGGVTADCFGCHYYPE